MVDEGLTDAMRAAMRPVAEQPAGKFSVEWLPEAVLAVMRPGDLRAFRPLVVDGNMETYVLYIA